MCVYFYYLLSLQMVYLILFILHEWINVNKIHKLAVEHAPGKLNYLDTGIDSVYVGQSVEQDRFWLKPT